MATGALANFEHIVTKTAGQFRASSAVIAWSILIVNGSEIHLPIGGR